MDELAGPDKDLLGVDDVARYLDVRPTTVYRWCREGRLPCLKIGKSWRIRRAALDEFLRRGERRRTLADHLRSFLTVPDHVISIAETLDLLDRLDAAFFQVGEARGGLLVKFYAGDPRSPDEMRRQLTRYGLEVARLEREGRLFFRREPNPLEGRLAALQSLVDEGIAEGRAIWVTFQWSEPVDLEAALRQQEALAGFIDAHQFVVKMSVLERATDEWASPDRRRVQRHYRGLIWFSESGLSLSREVPLADG